MRRILLLGGTGKIGKLLSRELIDRGYHLVILTRQNLTNLPNSTYITWNGRDIPTEAYGDYFAIINLVGAGLADKLWTAHRRQELYDSRVIPGQQLTQLLISNKLRSEVFLQISAIGYYGLINRDQPQTENEQHYPDFVGKLCYEWEQSTASIPTKRYVLRNGLVLIPKQSPWSELTMTLPLKLVVQLGNGKQWFNWIHWQDELQAIIFFLEKQPQPGTYNIVAPDTIRASEFSTTLLKLAKSWFKINIPVVLIRLLYGEAAAVLLTTPRVSGEKLVKAGFNFRYQNIQSAIEVLLN